MRLWKHLLNSFKEAEAMNNKAIFFLLIYMLTVSKLAFAHEGGHTDKNKPALEYEETGVSKNSIYAIDNEKETLLPTVDNDPLDFSLSSSDLLRDENSSTNIEMSNGEPMIRFEEKTNMEQHNQHQNQKQHVEKTTHQLVSSSAKGHGVAVGITIISGLTFAALSFSRTGEAKKKIRHNY